MLSETSPVTELLASAVPKPGLIDSPHGGAVLALAVHCLMVRDGWTVLDPSRSPRDTPPRSPYIPPATWNDMPSGCEWQFRYTKDGKANQFVLSCSLQEKTGKMFLHAAEEGSRTNIQILGLQLGNFLPDPLEAVMKAASWEGALSESAQAKLVTYVSEYITVPLDAVAVDAPLERSPTASPRGGKEAPRSKRSSSRRRAGLGRKASGSEALLTRLAAGDPELVLPLLAGVAGVAAAALVALLVAPRLRAS